MVRYERQHDQDPDYYIVGLNMDFEFPLHFHRCFELTLVLEGEMQVRREKENYTLRAGDMIFVGSNCIHDQRTVDSSKCLIAIFNPNIVAAVAPRFLNHPLKDPVLRNVSAYSIETFKALFEHHLWEKEGNENIAFTKGALYSLMSLFVDQLDPSVESYYADRHILLGKMFEYVEQHKETPCTLGELSRELEYSSVYLSRFFHENTGMPYHEYARMVKMNHACYLLKNTRESVLEVSLRCGYASLSSFNRSFKQIVGMNPTAYRKKP